MSNSRLVYSTGTGRLCPECARPVADCRCRRSKPAQPAAAAPRGDGIVRVARETKGRRGKGVTVTEDKELWDMPIVLFLLLIIMGSEWVYRRSHGLA